MNGHSSKGYAARNPHTFRDDNHINSDTALGGGHFLTKPEKKYLQQASDIRMKNHGKASMFDDLDM